MRSIRRSRATLSRSAAIASAMPGYWTFTATARPSRVIARCTWPIDAAAIGSGSHSANARSGGMPEFFGDDAGGQLGAHRRHAVLEPAERPPHAGRQALVDVAGHLADLHQDALHRPERLGDVFGRLKREVVAQLLPLLAGGGEQARRAPGIAHAAPGDELQRAPAPAAVAPGPSASRRAATPRPDKNDAAMRSLPRRAAGHAIRSLPAAASCSLRRAHPRGDPLPRLKHPWLADEDGVQHAERLPDLGAAGLGQRLPLEAVHPGRPLWQRAHRAVPDVLPDLGDVLVKPGGSSRKAIDSLAAGVHASSGRTESM